MNIIILLRTRTRRLLVGFQNSRGKKWRKWRLQQSEHRPLTAWLGHDIWCPKFSLFFFPILSTSINIVFALILQLPFVTQINHCVTQQALLFPVPPLLRRAPSLYRDKSSAFYLLVSSHRIVHTHVARRYLLRRTCTQSIFAQQYLGGIRPHVIDLTCCGWRINSTPHTFLPSKKIITPGGILRHPVIKDSIGEPQSRGGW